MPTKSNQELPSQPKHPASLMLHGLKKSGTVLDVTEIVIRRFRKDSGELRWFFSSILWLSERRGGSKSRDRNQWVSCVLQHPGK